MQEGLDGGRFGILQGLMKALPAACARLIEGRVSKMEEGLETHTSKLYSG